MTAIETIKTAREIFGRVSRKGIDVREPRRIAEMRLIWMPGARPVKVPKAIPTSDAKIISISIIINNLEVYIFCNYFIHPLTSGICNSINSIISFLN